jgi:hypothetical protein
MFLDYGLGMFLDYGLGITDYGLIVFGLIG